ncbi:hypothetical protein ILYODFUR_038593 [Ilyodon furcidens]|uniref:Uncharacterized protein n=1 Tax=Ilyodon furcidens TaxID=33524 RepID=A0ABV0VKK5_9TELE
MSVHHLCKISQSIKRTDLLGNRSVLEGYLAASRQTLIVVVLILKAGHSQKPRALRGEKQRKSIEAPA